MDARVPGILLSGRRRSLCVCRSDHYKTCVTPSREGAGMGPAWLEGWAVLATGRLLLSAASPRVALCPRRGPGSATVPLAGRLPAGSANGGRGLGRGEPSASVGIATRNTLSAHHSLTPVPSGALGTPRSRGRPPPPPPPQLPETACPLPSTGKLCPALNVKRPDPGLLWPFLLLKDLSKL